MSLPPTLPPDEAHAIETAERVASVFSVIGAAFVIFTFLRDRRFRKAINRLVFFASWGNLFANVATLISREGIKIGADGPLCQFQAFLIQWFMPADALFTFAMACNVYLTFFKQYDAQSLRKLEWRYLTICYGVPFIPAIVFLFIDTEERGKIYGSANLWCWISVRWNALRIAAFYGPVWIIILLNIFVYVRVGLVVLRWRRNLISLDLKAHTPTQPHRGPKVRPTYEVNVVSQVPHSRTRSLSSNRPLSAVHSTTSKDPLSPSHGRFASIEDRFSAQSADTHVNTTIHHRASQPILVKSRAVDANRATLSYCYTACLFFIALLVTWVPSSINRVYTLVHKSSQPSPFSLDFASGLVLPLQGFWNLIIYVVTSWAACRALWDEKVSTCLRRSNRKSLDLQLGSLANNGDRKQSGRDQYPISPASSNPNWPRNDSRINGRTSEAESETTRGERADIVMSLDERGRVIRQGRAQFDWTSPSRDRSPISALPDANLAPLRRSHSSTRGSRRSHASYQAHSRQGSGHIAEQMRGPSPRV